MRERKGKLLFRGRKIKVVIVQVKNAERLVPKKQTIKLEKIKVSGEWHKIKEIRKDEIETEESDE